MCSRPTLCILTAALLAGTADSGSEAQTVVDRTSEQQTLGNQTAPDHAKSAAKEQEDYYELLMVFADTIDQIDRNYVEKVSRRELLEAAIEGVLKKLDPYSNYIAPDEIDNFKVEVENEFGGIGIQIASRRGQLTVISPLVGTPAHRAGIQAGDIILAVNGTPTQDMSIPDAIKLMKGRPGTDLSLTVFHPLRAETEEVNLTRQIIKVETVLGDRRNPDDTWKYMYDDAAKIGYVRVSAFGRETAADLKRVMNELQQQGLRGLVLDLRFNPGGLLRSAIEVSDLFLPAGTIVSTEGRNIKPQSWEATKDGTFDDFPMAVIVNQFSASASEIVAAALQDHDRAVVVGQQTFGKASVQNVVELEGGQSALKLTTGSYQRPSGKPIHRLPKATEWGVRPTESFEVVVNNRDLQQLIALRRDKDIIKAQTDTEPTVNFDAPLRRALSYIQDETRPRDG